MRAILVADVPELDSRLISLLPGDELYFVRTLDEAVQALEREDFRLLVISVHFDDSRMFDLLRRVRAEGRHQAIPVLCLREPGLGLSAVSSHSLEVTCRALEANAFIDLAGLKDDDERNGALRAAIDRLSKAAEPGE